MKPSIINSGQFDLHWRGTLSDYVTAIAWSPAGQFFAASSAAGEVVLCYSSGDLLTLQEPTEQSVDCLAFSQDGQFLASGGQDGKVRIWQAGELIATLENSPAWVEQMGWGPKTNQLAFSLGRYVQVWDAVQNEIVVTLNFDASSVLGIDWRGDGQYLAIGGYQGVKIWDSQNWDVEPYILDVPSASLAIAWSPDGKFLASGNMDRTITVMEWNNPEPWIMQGFPGKVRYLAWSQTTTQLGVPLLASSSVEGIVIWEKHTDELVGWESRILTNHTDVIEAIAFAPNSFLLASAAADGWLCLWYKAKRVSQILQGAPTGFSRLAWHPQGNQLVAGGQNGELLIWSKGMRGQRFGRS